MGEEKQSEKRRGNLKPLPEIVPYPFASVWNPRVRTHVMSLGHTNLCYYKAKQKQHIQRWNRTQNHFAFTPAISEWVEVDQINGSLQVGMHWAGAGHVSISLRPTSRMENASAPISVAPRFLPETGLPTPLTPLPPPPPTLHHNGGIRLQCFHTIHRELPQ